MYNESDRTNLAIVSMALGLLFIWGVLVALLQIKLINSIKPVNIQTFKAIVVVVGFMTLLALIAEIVSTSMTNTASLWNLSPSEAYITASPNYIEVVTKYSVIAFIPQFLGVALIHSKYKFTGFQWFIIYGIIGYLNEWLAFGEAASWVSIPYWIIIYGWIAYLPTQVIRPLKDRLNVKFYHYVLAVLWPILISVPWVLLVNYWWHS